LSNWKGAGCPPPEEDLRVSPASSAVKAKTAKLFDLKQAGIREAKRLKT